jgi:predicted nucleic acid-binding Zn ribbon protein
MEDNKKNNEYTLKDALKAMIDHYKLKGKLNQNRVQSSWAKLMGPTIASYTREVRLYRKKLFLTIDSATLRQELSYGKDKIQRVMNEELGEEYIEEVIIR